jgi:hypothetical protein
MDYTEYLDSAIMTEILVGSGRNLRVSIEVVKPAMRHRLKVELMTYGMPTDVAATFVNERTMRALRSADKTIVSMELNNMRGVVERMASQLEHQKRVRDHAFNFNYMADFVESLSEGKVVTECNSRL